MFTVIEATFHPSLNVLELVAIAFKNEALAKSTSHVHVYLYVTTIPHFHVY